MLLESLLSLDTVSSGALPGGETTTVSLDDAPWVWKSPQAGVYDNVFDDLDTTPVDFHYSEPCDISPDPPYDSYAATDPFTSLAGYDGTCNSMPGWNPSFNPSSAPGCKINPMYNEPGLGYGASYGSGHPTAVGGSSTDMPTSMALAAATQLCGPAPKASKPATASPGHILMMGHALLFGAAAAVTEESDESFAEHFKIRARQAAAAVSPVSACILGTHVLRDAN